MWLYGTSQFDIGALLNPKELGDLVGPTASQGINWPDAAFKSLPAYPACKWMEPHSMPAAQQP